MLPLPLQPYILIHLLKVEGGAAEWQSRQGLTSSPVLDAMAAGSMVSCGLEAAVTVGGSATRSAIMNARAISECAYPGYC